MRRRLVFTLVVAIGITFFATHPVVWAMVRYWPNPGQLTIPVQGVAPQQLTGTFGAPRSEHRLHKGIDIFARRGTPVVAAADGKVFRVGQNRLGGNVVWVAGGGARLYYYAHLQRASVRSGDTVRAGDELGRVGNTGNARTTPPHLHFEIHPLSHGFRAIDPSPVLKTIGRRA
jgi:murein DD-endopeptidase MepM/ murein hydrolase activator NlpD